MKKRKSKKEQAWAEASTFEKVLVRGYQIAFVVFSLWAGWVIYDEVQMRQDSVATMAMIYNVRFISPEEAASKGLCKLRGRNADCDYRYTFTVEFQASGRKRTAEFTDTSWNPGSRKSVCINYVKSKPEIVKFCHAFWFKLHKDYFGFPFGFWSLTIMGALGIAVTIAAEKVKQRFRRASQPPPKQQWYRINDRQTGHLLLETNNKKEVNILLNQKKITAIRGGGNSEIVTINGRKIARSWVIYDVIERTSRRTKKKTS